MNLWRRTGALEKNMIFCNEATGPDGKEPIVKRLELTHFIDDRVDILDSLLDLTVQQEKEWKKRRTEIPPFLDHLYQYSEHPSSRDFSNADRFDVIGGWKEILGHLRVSSFQYDAPKGTDSIKEPSPQVAAPVVCWNALEMDTGGRDVSPQLGCWIFGGVHTRAGTPGTSFS